MLSLRALIKQLEISDPWDAIIVGDGSGMGWDMEAGWAAVLIDHYSGARKLMSGSFNVGTVMIGEMMPYVHALLWYFSKGGPGKRRAAEAQASNRVLEIHIVTDSLSVKSAGENPAGRSAHLALWAAMDAFKRYGCRLHYHYIPRDTVNLHVLVDAVSRASRLSAVGSYQAALNTLAKAYQDVSPDLSIYDFTTGG